ncbi:hypothetical protein [Aliiroseovarius lamellibrachiae]|uniref:hypothetical protein n=1 Tax=Aliiroseovarius lamellibrachiae TaxID=1924933 RepID=UPI001BDFBC9B|nr:hypothetical protein [Aliiroseovarius lamellibrachiae]MBT2130110.1 hypothetical protein [Aliiroseovarius lamellibrachiae]
MAEPIYTEISQAEFARKMEVSRAAVSQWKTNDILRDDAFSKPGKKGKLRYEIAVEQVRRNRDIGQALGNGIETRISADVSQEACAPKPKQPVEDQLDLLSVPAPVSDEQAPNGQIQSKAPTVQDELAKAKLEEQRRKNRIGAAEEALRQGQLMSAEDARAQMTRIAGMMLQIFEGSLTDFAAVIASQFKVPQRDVLHLLKNEFRNVRKSATQKERSRIANLEENTTASVDLEE